MAFKPNYRFGRVERDRLKQAKKDEKLKRQQENVPPCGATAVRPTRPKREICRKPDFRAAAGRKSARGVR
jgi:hypothetical protein